MKFSIISKEVVTAFKERKQIVIIATIVALSNLVLVAFLFANKERVVLVPAQINTQMWTERKAVSKEYLEEMTLFFAHLLFDVSPHSMGYQRDVILRNVDPAAYNSLKHKLIKEEEKYKKENLTTTFRPTKIIVNTSKLETIVIGYLTSFVGGKQMQQITDTYLIKFRYDAGRLFIKSFEAKACLE
jgi:conjugal transfer pilus assembly protein TraE